MFTSACPVLVSGIGILRVGAPYHDRARTTARAQSFSRPRCYRVSLTSFRMSPRHDSSLARKYSRCSSFMKGSLALGRYFLVSARTTTLFFPPEPFTAAFLDAPKLTDDHSSGTQRSSRRLRPSPRRRSCAPFHCRCDMQPYSCSSLTPLYRTRGRASLLAWRTYKLSAPTPTRLE